MRLFEGLQRTDYQDVLRAIGLLMDEHGYRNFRLIEHEDGIVVQVMPSNNGQPRLGYETFLLTDRDIERLLQQAYQRRRGQSPAHHVHPWPSTWSFRRQA